MEEKDETVVDATLTPDLAGEDTYEEKETPSQKTEEDIEEPKSSEPEKAEKSKEIKSLAAQKEHWRKKYEEEAKRASHKKEPETESEWKNKVEFLIKNREYNEEEFDHIATVAARKGVSLDEAAKAESEYITFKREKVANENKTPSPSSVQSFLGDKTISKDTSPEEIDKILEQRFKETQMKRSGY
jgi:hypothetical protein